MCSSMLSLVHRFDPCCRPFVDRSGILTAPPVWDLKVRRPRIRGRCGDRASACCCVSAPTISSSPSSPSCAALEEAALFLPLVGHS